MVFPDKHQLDKSSGINMVPYYFSTNSIYRIDFLATFGNTPSPGRSQGPEFRDKYPLSFSSHRHSRHMPSTSASRDHI